MSEVVSLLDRMQARAGNAAVKSEAVHLPPAAAEGKWRSNPTAPLRRLVAEWVHAKVRGV